MDFGGADGQHADKRHKSASGDASGDGQTGGLASLMQYGSDDDEEAERPNVPNVDGGRLLQIQ